MAQRPWLSPEAPAPTSHTHPPPPVGMPHVPPPPDPEAALLDVVPGPEPPMPPVPPVPPPAPALPPPEPPEPPEPPMPAKQLPSMHCCPAGQTTPSQAQLSQAPVFGSQQLPSTQIGFAHALGTHTGVAWL